MLAKRFSFTIATYIIRETIPYYIISAGLLTFIIYAQQFIRQTEIFQIDGQLSLTLRTMACLLPGILTITIPFAALLSTLLVINQLSSNRESVSISASGMSTAQTAVPLMLLGLGATTITLALTIYVNPLSIRSLKNLRIQALKRALELRIKPQTLTSVFRDYLIYINSVSQDSGEWKGIFVYHPTSENGALIVSAARGRIQVVSPLNEPGIIGIQMEDGITITSGNTGNQQSQTTTKFKRSYIKLSDSDSDTTLLSDQPGRTVQELSFSQLASQATNLPRNSAEQRQATIEWHKRLALAASAVVLVMLAIPIGLALSGISGRTSTVILGLAIATGYYFATIAGQNLTMTGVTPPFAGLWAASALGISISLLTTLKQRRIAELAGNLLPDLKSHLFRKAPAAANPAAGKEFRGGKVLNTVSLMLLSEFAKFAALSTLTIVTLTIIFTLSDLVPSIARNRVPLQFVAGYLWQLSPQLLYLCTPFGLLLGMLFTFGLLTRTSQLTALSAHGLSPYQIFLPLITAAIVTSLALFYLSEKVLPESNRRQDERYNRIKGRNAEQATMAFGQKWVYGTDHRLYSFQHISESNHLLNATVYNLDNPSHTLCEITHADRAVRISDNVWQAVSGGWHENFCDNAGQNRPDHPASFQVAEGVALFRRTTSESSKMNLSSLARHIRQLSAAGIPASSLKVDLEKKKVFPFFSLVLIVLAFPFCLTATSRRLLVRLNLSLILCLTFWTVSHLLESMGKQGRLSAELAVWGGPAAFLALGIYLFFRVGK
ncbi:MAG TPA: LptF/LptG family permease [Blastocatellia bacterium]|nr:LptF/LptG family permease [Blastocatellia bacterium]